MRSISDWLEDTLAAEPKPKTPITVQKVYPYVFGALSGVWLSLANSLLHWRPVWGFLVMMTCAVVGGYVVYGQIGPWWRVVLFYVGGVLLTTLVL
jgi:hypothetical protein